MKKKLIRRILAVAVIATFLIGTMSFAQESDTEIPREEMQVIDADDIGVKTVSKEVATNEIIIPETENQVMDESPVYMEKVENEEPAEAEKEDTLPEEDEHVDEEDLDIPPEGMYEGYVSGEYFPINCYDCELHDGCYKCEECKLVEEIDYDEEINPNGGCYLYKYCVVCGHGDCIPINESEN